MTAPSAPAPGLHLSGPPRFVDAAGQSRPLALADALLLAWLGVEGPTAREQMATQLWPDSPPETARNALRQRLFRLRRQAGRDLVEGSAVLALPADLTHDLAGATTLLGDLDAAAFPGLAEWLAGQRQQRRGWARRQLEDRIEALEAAGDAAAALPLALALRDADPLSEDAHRRVMRLHYLRGDRAAALLAFDTLERLLKDEVGTAPSAPTLALLRSIEGELPPAPPRHAPTWRAELPASVLRPPRLIGRTAELQALQAGWAAAQVVLVVGEAGMGKSRLLQAWAAAGPAASAAREPLLLSACRPGDALVPYASLARLLNQLLQTPTLAPDDDDRRHLGPLLPGLSDQAPPAIPRRASLVAPVQALLQRASAVFDGFVLDDLHFADDASVELLQSLLAAPRSERPLRWCLGLRPPAANTGLAHFVEALGLAAPLVRVHLQALDVAQVAELIDSLGLPSLDSATLAGPLRQRSGGNPLFALETLKLALAENRLGAGSELPRPQSLGHLIGQQLARLSPAALMLARLAAVAGIDFDLPLAEKVLGQSPLQLADPWSELERQQVMIGTDFAHDLIFEAVLAGIPAVIARHLHGQVAERLEAGGGEPARVAAHWEAAGQRARALPGLRAAAERAHRALRERERLGFLLRAADIAEGTGALEPAYDLIVQAVETHMNSIRQADGFPLLDRLDGLARTPVQLARALGLRAWYCSQLADLPQAVAIGEQALALAEPLSERTLTAQIRQRLGTALSMLGRFDDALPHLQAVQAWADAEMRPEDLAEFHGNFAVALDNLGRPGEALPHHRRALEASFAAGDHPQRATQLANHAVNRLNAGDVESASALLTQARQLIRSFDLQGGSAAFATVLQMQCARATGRYRDALALGDEAEALLRASIPARLPVVELQRGHCWLELGQWARAGQALQAPAVPLPPHFETRRLLLLARLRHWQGLDPEPALAQAEHAAPANGWPEVRMMATVERAWCSPASASGAALRAVAEQAGQLGLEGSVLAALLALALHEGSADRARQALTLAQRVEPSLRYRADVAAAAAQALRKAGLDDEARAVARAGLAWVEGIAEQQVDAAFRESFLHRNPVNIALRALAGPA